MNILFITYFVVGFMVSKIPRESCIRLLSTIYKILIHSLNLGFLTGKSTGLQLISFYKHIYKSRDASSLSDIVYIDLDKAFDKVSHTKLLHKLSHYGICGDVIMWLKSYLNNSK